MGGQYPDPAIGAIIGQPVAGWLIGEIEYDNELSAVVGVVTVNGQYGAAQVGPDIIAGEIFQKRMCFSQGDQLPVPVQQQTVFSLLPFAPL